MIIGTWNFSNIFKKGYEKSKFLSIQIGTHPRIETTGPSA